jgi:hypothetical protein
MAAPKQQILFLHTALDGTVTPVRNPHMCDHVYLTLDLRTDHAYAVDARSHRIHWFVPDGLSSALRCAANEGLTVVPALVA